jgi:hypothetical protein
VFIGSQYSSLGVPYSIYAPQQPIYTTDLDLQKLTSDDTIIKFKTQTAVTSAVLKCDNTNNRFYMQYSKYSNAEIGVIGNGTANMQININSINGFYLGSSNLYSATAEANNTVFIDTVLKVSGLSYGNGYNTFTNYSDERLKQNIIDIDLDKCYENFKTLKFKRFKYIYDVSKLDKTETGLIAQDILLTNFNLDF